jgi:hypothetical protein
MSKELLKEGHAGKLILNDGTPMNYGVIEIRNSNLVHYTGKGLREIFPQSPDEAQKLEKLRLEKLDEATLIQSGHVKITPISEIGEVLN